MCTNIGQYIQNFARVWTSNVINYNGTPMQLNITDHGLCDTFPVFGGSNNQGVRCIFHCLGVHVFTGKASQENQNGLLPTLRLHFIVYQGDSHVMVRDSQKSQRLCNSQEKVSRKLVQGDKNTHYRTQQQLFTDNEDLCHESRRKNARHIYNIWWIHILRYCITQWNQPFDTDMS